MTEDLFNSSEAEARRIADELREAKELLRDISRRIAHIEARVRRAFPSVSPVKVSSRGSSAPPDAPTLSSSDALALYRELVTLMQQGEAEAVRSRLNQLRVPDLTVLRRELGVSLGKKKPSARAEIAAIVARMNESVHLSAHTNRQQLIDRSAPSATTGDRQGDPPDRPEGSEG
jgi:hypothetical protein